MHDASQHVAIALITMVGSLRKADEQIRSAGDIDVTDSLGAEANDALHALVGAFRTFIDAAAPEVATLAKILTKAEA